MGDDRRAAIRNHHHLKAIGKREMADVGLGLGPSRNREQAQDGCDADNQAASERSCVTPIGQVWQMRSRDVRWWVGGVESDART
jgi:hypothetical protein